MLKFVIFDENYDICLHGVVIWVPRILKSVELFRVQECGRKMDVFEGTRHHGSLVKGYAGRMPCVSYMNGICVPLYSVCEL